jgi:hypothetical protein
MDFPENKNQNSEQQSNRDQTIPRSNVDNNLQNQPEQLPQPLIPSGPPKTDNIQNNIKPLRIYLNKFWIIFTLIFLVHVWLLFIEESTRLNYKLVGFSFFISSVFGMSLFFRRPVKKKTVIDYLYYTCVVIGLGIFYVPLIYWTIIGSLFAFGIIKFEMW